MAIAEGSNVYDDALHGIDLLLLGTETFHFPIKAHTQTSGNNEV